MEVGAVEDGSLALGASTAGSGGDLHTDRTGETLVDGTVPQDWDEELLALFWGAGAVNMSDCVMR